MIIVYVCCVSWETDWKMQKNSRDPRVSGSDKPTEKQMESTRLGHSLAAGGLMGKKPSTVDDGVKSVAMPVAIETFFCQLYRL